MSILPDVAGPDRTSLLMKKTLIACSFLFILVAVAIITAETAATATEHKVINPADLQWSDSPPSLPAGAKMAVLDGDPNKAGNFTARLKAPAGYRVPPHTHPTAERLTVISGSLKIGMGDKLDGATAQEIGPGSFVVLPAGMKHFAISTGESVVQINSEGPFQINYVNPSDDPRNAKK